MIVFIKTLHSLCMCLKQFEQCCNHLPASRTTRKQSVSTRQACCQQFVTLMQPQHQQQTVLQLQQLQVHAVCRLSFAPRNSFDWVVCSNWVQLSCKAETLITFRKFQQQLAKIHFVAIDCVVELQADILAHTEPRGACLEDRRTASGSVGYKSYGIELGSSDKRPVSNCCT